MATAPHPPILASMRALQAVLEEYDAFVSERAGLGRNDWRCLRLLVEHGSTRPTVLQKALSLTSGSVTALLDRLETRALVDRAPSPHDRRGLQITATKAAHALLADAQAPLADIARRLSERLGNERSAAQIKHITDCVKIVEWAGVRASS